ncbi:MAG: NUDIX domain-containing protein [Alphaproteobacteria bacterium]|nr:NUDIX domain-containing protein [Alphaproteobacteria bacterium]
MNAPGPTRIVRPRDAASLVLIRHAEKGPEGAEVLMGRRRPKASFIPDAFVFPGGRLDPEDRRVHPARPLTPETEHDLLRTRAAASAAEARALANAVVRETWEETGLLITRDGDPGAGATGDWRGLREKHQAPDHHALEFLGRAITPTDSPIRFHARFFLMRTENGDAPLSGSGELLDLAWFPLHEALGLPIIDVTEFMLGEAKNRLADPETPRAIFTYRGGKPAIRRVPR